MWGLLGRGISLIAVAALLCGVALPAAADPVTGNCGFAPDDIYAKEFQCDRYGEFYTPPDPLPGGIPGDLIRSEPMRLVYEPSGQLGRLGRHRHADHVPQHRLSW